MAVKEHEQKIMDYYTFATERFYCKGWSKNYLHFGLFNKNWKKNKKKFPFSSFDQLSPVFKIKLQKEEAFLNKINFILNLVKMNTSDIIIDAACGIGGLSIDIAQKFGCRVFGLNISPEQIEIANKKIQEEKLQDLVSMIQTDCTKELPFHNNYADAIFIIQALCHFSNKTQFFSESNRILKKGGYLICDLWVSKNNLSKELYNNYIQPVCDFWLYKSLESLSIYKKMLKKAGFKILKNGLYPQKIFLPNVLLLENGYNLFRFMQTHTGIDKEQELIMNQLGSLVKAYDKKCINFGYILAQKA